MSEPKLPGGRGRGSDPDDPHAVRMTIGEHLDELRRCVLRGLIALVIGCLICIWPAKYVLEATVRPLRIALIQNGQPDSLLGTSPTEPLIWYIKIVLFLGVVVSSPYVIYQLWSFVAKGLYRREKEWAYKLVPISVSLFLGGIAFMYTFVLLLSLDFLIGFSTWLPLPSAEPMAIQKLLGIDTIVAPTSQPSPGEVIEVPSFFEDPKPPPDGGLWFNTFERKLKYAAPDRVYSVQLQRDDKRPLVTMHLKIGDYLTYVLVLAVAFGLAFQLPLVVVFLTRTGIVSRDTFKRYRKVVILVIVIIAGAIAPPDLASHLLLSVPMYALFELGLLLSRPKPAKAGTETET